MILKLTPEEIAQDDADAWWHIQRATANDWHGVGFMPEAGIQERLRLTELGYRAERAAAHAFGVPLNRNRDGFHAADVAGHLVRCGSRPGYGLVARLGAGGDPDLPYLLVECLTPDTFRIVGTSSRDRILRLKAAGIGRSLPGTHDPWLIPQRHLLPWQA